MSARTPTSLSSGTKLGPYEIVAPLGAGGMGEVYRARDPRLGREVAIKVLPAHLIDNAEARARFEREARSVSTLNHPNICVLHDVGREGDTDFLVMELIEGETLAERIARGPLPISDVLRFGAQIADALDRAHRAGVIHRDLKPSNVMLTKSGAKLMDFGLARSAGPGAAGVMTQAPTAADPVTAQGTILGTFQYMAPEQLEAREADARTDLWALGCVLYEMATAARPFSGGTSASLISAILRDTPRPMMELAPLSPPAFERAVKQCLAKDPDDRWQSAGDLKRELEWVAGGSGISTVVATTPRRGNRALVLAGTAAMIVAIGLLAWQASRRTPERTIEATLMPPPGVEIASTVSRAQPLAITQDGSQVAFVGHENSGVDRIWVRTLGDGKATAIAGTERAESPFFSPDGHSIGFFADGRLKRVDVAGGPVTTLTEVSEPRGGTWSTDGHILYTPHSIGPVFRIPATGGSPVAVSQVDSTVGESTHRFPHMLPDGRHFLYLARRAGQGAGRAPTIFVADVRNGSRKPLVQIASNVQYASGHLLYVQQGLLVAHPFDADRQAVSGRPRPVMSDVTMDERFSRASFAVSRNGVLIGITGKAETRTQLRWRNRDGSHAEKVGEPAHYVFGGSPCISPDGRSTAMPIVDPARGNADIWVIDLASGRQRRVTADTEDHYACIWDPDGRSVVMTSGLPPSSRYFAIQALDGMARYRPVEAVPRHHGGMYPIAFAPDGRTLLYAVEIDPGIALMTADWTGTRPPTPLLPGKVSGTQTLGAFSPDGRFVVYDSDETGRFEVYVTPFPATGERWQVSRDGGLNPRWSRNGRELYYIDLENRLMSVEVTPSGGALQFSPARLLFTLSSRPNTRRWVFDEGSDGRFLVVELPEGSSVPFLRLLTHWTARLDSK